MDRVVASQEDAASGITTGLGDHLMLPFHLRKPGMPTPTPTPHTRAGQPRLDCLADSDLDTARAMSQGNVEIVRQGRRPIDECLHGVV